MEQRLIRLYRGSEFQMAKGGFLSRSAISQATAGTDTPTTAAVIQCAISVVPDHEAGLWGLWGLWSAAEAGY